jgi:hypothetical protein
MTEFLTRRNVLIGAAAAGAVAFGGVTWATTADLRYAVLAFYKRARPGVTIDEKSALAGIDEFVSDWSTPKRLVLQTAWNVAGVDTMAELNGRFESVARHMLTHFLINSNFFYVQNPRAQPIVYVSRPPGTPCGNPWANLEPPTASEIARHRP